MATRREREEPVDDFDDAEAIEGGEAARSKILPFLKTKVEKNAETDEVSFSITLCQNAHGSDKMLKRYSFDVEADDVEEFVDDVIEDAEDDASQYPGKTRYSLKVAINGKVTHTNFSLTNLEGGPDGSGRGVSDEINDPRSIFGAFGQQMRHNEAFADKLVQQTSANTDRLLKMLDVANDRIRELETREREQIPLLAELHDMGFRKELAVEAERNSMALKQQVAGTLMQVAPHLLGGLLPMLGQGQHGGPQGPHGAPMPPMPPPGQVAFHTQAPAASNVDAAEVDVLRRMAMHVQGLTSSLAARPEKLQALQSALDHVDMLSLMQIQAAIEDLKRVRGQSPATSQASAPPSSPPSPSGNGFVPFGSKPAGA